MISFKNTKTKIGAVLTVLAVLCAGFVLVSGSEDSEAVTVQTPIASLVKDADDVYTDYNNGITSYLVAQGTYIYINHVVGADYAFEITAMTTSYGDDAGLTYTDTGGVNRVAGTIDKATSGTVSITIEFRDQGGEDDITLTLTVLDTSSSSSNPWSTVNLPASIADRVDTFYAVIGSSVTITHNSALISGTTFNYNVTDVTSGFGLSVDGSHNLTGTITQSGTITVDIEVDDGVDSETDTITIVVASNHADVRMIGGETWTYTPAFNLTGTISLSGTASSWCTESAGTITATAPTGTNVGATYDLTITVTSTNPAQTATQTVTFTVDPQITVAGPGTAQSIVYGSGSTTDLISSNFEDGTRSIYSVSGGNGYSINAVSGIISYSNPDSTTLTVTATSPYTYTSGATNSATTTVTFDVVGRLTASVSGTLYLVTAKTVPNTPAEAVTLSHNDVGVGTYTWAVVGTNDSGVTVASNGTIGGTPGDIGTYALTVRCTSDVSGVQQTADTILNVVIVAVLVFTTSPTQGTVL